MHVVAGVINAGVLVDVGSKGGSFCNWEARMTLFDMKGFARGFSFNLAGFFVEDDAEAEIQGFSSARNMMDTGEKCSASCSN